MASAIRLAIVIPTRGRPELAQVAALSVLSQQVPHVQVVVSDNSIDAGSPSALAAWRESSAPGAEIIGPPVSMGMTEHWEWALAEVLARYRPTHVAITTDRHIWHPGELARAMHLLERHPANLISFRSDVVDELSAPVVLRQVRTTQHAYRVPVPVLLRLASRGSINQIFPVVLNTIAPVAVLERVQVRFGTVFSGMSPDMNLCFRSLAVSDEIVFLDRACLLQHAQAVSSGTSFSEAQPNVASRDFASRRPGGRVVLDVPAPDVLSLTNGAMHEYLAVRGEADDPRFPALDRRSYGRALWAETANVRDPEVAEATRQYLGRVDAAWSRSSLHDVGSRAVRSLAFLARHPVVGGYWLVDRLNPFGRADRSVRRFSSAHEAVAWALGHPGGRTRAPAGLTDLLAGKGVKDLGPA